MAEETTFTLDEVLKLGFEASCVDQRGALWLVHANCGLRVDPESDARLLVTDPARLPDGPWRATSWGQAELAAGCTW